MPGKIHRFLGDKMTNNENQDRVFLEDSRNIWKKIDPEKFRNKSVLITGATGLIGATLTRAFLYANSQEQLNMKIVLLVRDPEKAKMFFGETSGLKLIQCDILRIPLLEFEIDYIVHCANPTASSFFLNNPVDTISIAVCGTKNVLEIAREKNVKGMVFLSSMEVYGFPERGVTVTENMQGGFDPTQPRNSYPISKQLCESLCCAYAAQYHVPAKIVRLTQTFGPGVDSNDRRIFAEFARCKKEKRNIILMTSGQTERCYLYTADAVTAILTVLLSGQAGQAYTAANPDTYCSIYQMAQEFARENHLDVELNVQDAEKLGYAKTLYMKLSTKKIESLGWHPEVGLKEMFRRMMEAM